MTKVAIIHTTPATVEPLKALAMEVLSGCELINFVDDSILPQLAQNGGDISAVEERLTHYARFAEQAGADIILEACSSVESADASGTSRRTAGVTFPHSRFSIIGVMETCPTLHQGSASTREPTGVYPEDWRGRPRALSRRRRNPQGFTCLWQAPQKTMKAVKRESSTALSRRG